MKQGHERAGGESDGCVGKGWDEAQYRVSSTWPSMNSPLYLVPSGNINFPWPCILGEEARAERKFASVRRSNSEELRLGGKVSES